MSNRFHKIFILALIVCVFSLTASWAVAKLSSRGSKAFPGNVLTSFDEGSVPKHEVREIREYEGSVEVISLKMISTDLTLKSSPDSKIHLEFHGLNPTDQKNAFNETALGGHLEIDSTDQEGSPSKHNFNWGSDHFHWESTDDDSRKMTLSVPANWKGELRVTTISGDIIGDGIIFNQLNAATTSGNIEISDAKLKNFKCSTVSGDLSFDGEAKLTQVGSVSGNLNLNYVDFVDKVDAESVSGDIDLSLLTHQGIVIDITSVSGELTSHPQIPINEAIARKNLKGKLGDGSATISGRTVSGDFHIDVEN